MTTNKEIAEWLREAGLKIWAAEDDKLARAIIAHYWQDRAAQVDAMGDGRCRTCGWWDNSPWQIEPEQRLCMFPEKRSKANEWGFVEACGPDFGCIHYEPAPPKGDGE